MNYPHRIRLRGPWEYSLPGGKEFRRIHMPCVLSQSPLREEKGPITLVRKFGYPGNIDADERVWLTIAGLANDSSIALNEVLLLSDCRGDLEFEVSKLLSTRNRLEIATRLEVGQERTWDEVALEIRCTAFLSNLQLHRDGARLSITGDIVGEAPGPMELYVVIDRHNAAYQQVDTGASFSLTDITLDPGAEKIKVELVNGSTVWYAWERRLT